MKYVLRDSHGIMKAQFEGAILHSLMQKLEGNFRHSHGKDGSTLRVMEITEGRSLTLAGIKLYFWKGDTLAPYTGANS